MNGLPYVGHTGGPSCPLDTEQSASQQIQIYVPEVRRAVQNLVIVKSRKLLLSSNYSDWSQTRREYVPGTVLYREAENKRGEF